MIDLAKECDEAISLKCNKALDKAIQSCCKFEILDSQENKAKINYFLGNLYTAKSVLSGETREIWKTNNNDDLFIIKAYEHYLEALNNADLSTFELSFQIRINLANTLNFFMLTIESLDEYYTNFNMLHTDAPYNASYAKIDTLIVVASFIDDKVIKKDYLFEAYNLIKLLSDKLDHLADTAFINMVKNNDRFNEVLQMGDKYFLDKVPLVDKKTSIPKQSRVLKYKKWNLENRLCLNLLNDLTNSAFVATEDILQFPSYSSTCTVIPHLSAAFSAIKRDFCSARYLAFEGITFSYPKFEEKHLFLTSTLDGANFNDFYLLIENNLVVDQLNMFRYNLSNEDYKQKIFCFLSKLDEYVLINILEYTNDTMLNYFCSKAPAIIKKLNNGRYLTGTNKYRYIVNSIINNRLTDFDYERNHLGVIKALVRHYPEHVSNIFKQFATSDQKDLIFFS